MTKCVYCPKCKAQINHLILRETKTEDFTVTFDEEADEFEFENIEEWKGNPTGEVDEQLFKCPICDETLFRNEADAKAFMREETQKPKSS